MKLGTVYCVLKIFVRRDTIERSIILLVRRFLLLGENESGVLFRINKICWFAECTTPYDRPSFHWYSKKLNNGLPAMIVVKEKADHNDVMVSILAEASC